MIKKITFCIILILISIILLNFISIKSDKAFNSIGFRTYTILTGSMYPNINPGDIVVVENKNKTSLNKNDIITFKANNTVITHRIVDIKDSTYITKGDNNDVIDPFTINYKDILGKVIFKIPKIGYLLEFLSRPLVMSAEMIILGILIVRGTKNTH